MVDGACDIVDELIRHLHAGMERELRNYLRKHRTTRLHIELIFPEAGLPSLQEGADREVFLREMDRDAYSMFCKSEFYIRQKIPVGWRAPLPD